MPEVIIIGAGPAGLATAACLKKRGVTFQILEQADRIAISWNNHYDRLKLHTEKVFSQLPYMPIPAAYPKYVPKLQFVEYLNQYAEKFEIRPLFWKKAENVQFVNNRWKVQASGEDFESRFLVIATGHNSDPWNPEFVGKSDFKGQMIHSKQYRNGNSFKGQDVLVVGIGNTGAEIALDLVEYGARPAISIRSPVHVTARDLFFVSAQRISVLTYSHLPAAWVDFLVRPILRLKVGDLSRYGIVRPKEGLARMCSERNRLPLIDIGTVAQIKAGKIRTFPNVSKFTSSGARFVDGREASFDTVILATGYRPGFRHFLKSPESSPGLYFVGFHNSITGLLREVSIESLKVADEIALRKDGTK